MVSSEDDFFRESSQMNTENSGSVKEHFVHTCSETKPACYCSEYESTLVHSVFNESLENGKKKKTENEISRLTFLIYRQKISLVATLSQITY